MRPPDVRRRVTALLDEQRDAVLSDGRRAARSRVEWFVQLCGRLGFGDVTAAAVLRAYREVAGRPRPDDSGSGFGARLGRCVDEVGAALEAAPGSGEDDLERVFTTLPPAIVLGASEPDVFFHLVCVTAAHSALDGIDTPYLAARAVAGMSVYRPNADFGVVAAAQRLAIRYEDAPDARDTVDTEIRTTLAAYLAAAPFNTAP